MDSRARKARLFYPAMLAIAALAAFLQLVSVRDETQTFDEDVHLAAGYSYWRTGDFRLNIEHPPLAKLLCAAPLLWLNPELRVQDAEWKEARQNDLAPVFLYANRVPAERMLFAARLVTVAITSLLILTVALWARAQLGAGAALFAAWMVALDPNILAHGRYVTNDVLAALTYLLALAAWVRYLRRKRGLDLLLAGLALGLAFTAKFSMMVLLPVFAAIYGFRAWQEDGEPGGLSVDRFFGSLIAVCAVAALVVLAVYGKWPWIYGPLAEAAPRDLGTFRAVAGALRLPAHPFLTGLADVMWHNHLGHPTYLLGEVSQHGRWYYFPVAFAVKSPTALLLLTGVAAVLAAGRVRGLRQAPLAAVAALIAVAVYFGVSIGSGIQLGVRHLLPIYPLLYILVAASARGLRRGVMAVLICAAILQAAECARIHPYYLAFFNTPAGGPARGPDYLLDSNIDWGQDLLRLQRYMDAHGETRPCIRYFGRDAPARYFAEPREVPKTYDHAGREHAGCLAAVSATLLYGVYVPASDYAWLRAMRPMARVGYSIYVYDLRKGGLLDPK